MATHSRILAWRIPWTEEPGGLQSIGSHKESDMTEATEHRARPSEDKQIPSNSLQEQQPSYLHGQASFQRSL